MPRIYHVCMNPKLKLAKSFDISESIPRRCSRQTTRANHPAETPKKYCRISLYYPFLDHLITELASRLLKSGNRFHAQYILPRAVSKITDDHVATVCEACQADIDFSLEDFRRKVARWRIHWVITKCNDLPTAFCTTLDSVNPVLDPSIMCFVSHASSKCYC
jgi:hypothetical protein